jgi:hypothetical protein
MNHPGGRGEQCSRHRLGRAGGGGSAAAASREEGGDVCASAAAGPVRWGSLAARGEEACVCAAHHIAVWQVGESHSRVEVCVWTTAAKPKQNGRACVPLQRVGAAAHHVAVWQVGEPHEGEQALLLLAARLLLAVKPTDHGLRGGTGEGGAWVRPAKRSKGLRACWADPIHTRPIHTTRRRLSSKTRCRLLHTSGWCYSHQTGSSVSSR